MGRFKIECGEKYKEINNLLLKRGYKENKNPHKGKGLTKIYRVCGDLYCVWVTFDFSDKKIYIYKEYNFGGEVVSSEIEIEKTWFINLATFINKADEELEGWIGDE